MDKEVYEILGDLLNVSKSDCLTRYNKVKDYINNLTNKVAKYEEVLDWLSEHMIDVVNDPDAYGYNEECKDSKGRNVIELFMEVLKELR